MNRLYDAAYLSAITATLPYWIFQSVRTGKYREGLADRWSGRGPDVDATRSRIWVHAVSLGEVLMVRPLVERLSAERPDLQIVLSSTTDTGVTLAQARFANACVFRSPLDFTWAVRRTLDRVSPSLLVLAEGELWPNLLLEANERRIPVCVVNARLSHRSHAAYRRIGPVIHRALASIRWWGAQTDEHADHIRDLCGPDGGKVEVTGSLKFDGVLSDRTDPRVQQMKKTLRLSDSHRVIVAGSTMTPEEEIIAEIWPALSAADPQLRLVLVPRHPERFDLVAHLLTERGIRFVRRSQLQGRARPDARVILLDSVGELAAVWGLAEFGYVGGSLECRRGGQSMIEPAGFGVPCCFGPETRNYRAIAEELVAHRGALRVRNRDDLRQTLLHWARHPEEAASVGRQAAEFVRRHQGATDRTVTALRRFLPPVLSGKFSA